MYCQLGWPEKRALVVVVLPYYPVAMELSVEGGLLMRGLLLLRLDMVHAGHQGTTKCRDRTSKAVCVVAWT